jgi:hypothetical protein
MRGMARTDVTYFYTSGQPATDRSMPAQTVSTSSSSSVTFSYTPSKR